MGTHFFFNAVNYLEIIKSVTRFIDEELWPRFSSSPRALAAVQSPLTSSHWRRSLVSDSVFLQNLYELYNVIKLGSCCLGCFLSLKVLSLKTFYYLHVLQVIQKLTLKAEG